MLKFDWVSPENHLLLNPRLGDEARERYQTAWEQFVTPQLDSHVGIATSGSSGEMGRLILLSKTALLVSAHAANEHLKATKSDVWMKVLPDFHVGGLSIRARSHLVGNRVVESMSPKWDPAAFMNELRAASATLLSLVPTQLFDLVQLNLKAPSSLRAVIVGGGRLESELHRKALNLGWPALPSYGMTECGSQVATAMTEAPAGGIKPLSHVEFRISSQERIEIRSAGLLTAQIRFEGERAHFEDPKQDGWFSTEDRGRIEADGSLSILGRTQDFVKIGGEGVIVSRLEERLESLKLTRQFKYDAALLAAFDDRLGATLVLIASAPEDAAQVLAEAFNSNVMPFERIRSIKTVDSVPRSALGKLLRREALALIGLKPVADV